MIRQHSLQISIHHAEDKPRDKVVWAINAKVRVTSPLPLMGIWWESRTPKLAAQIFLTSCSPPQCNQGCRRKRTLSKTAAGLLQRTLNWTGAAIEVQVNLQDNSHQLACEELFNICRSNLRLLVSFRIHPPSRFLMVPSHPNCLGKSLIYAISWYLRLSGRSVQRCPECEEHEVCHAEAPWRDLFDTCCITLL